MNITTKYNIGDTVWTVKDNKAYSFYVSHISITIENEVLITYSSGPTRHFIRRDEFELSGSREELINLL